MSENERGMNEQMTKQTSESTNRRINEWTNE